VTERNTTMEYILVVVGIFTVPFGVNWLGSKLHLR
jgi:hypothetical protein